MANQRLGLALSGGGFRAAFFHVGVLARMAELDLLRHVESISTVSGGSIIGVLYYLRLKELLERKSDNQVTQQDYLALVSWVEEKFVASVQQNLRMRTFSSIHHNLKMVLPSYSRSDRIGELYDEYIFRPAWKEQRDTPIMMHELKIYPKLDDGQYDMTFNPTKGGNDQRRNKVPVLNINATVLNTGHNWHFTASEMGEVIHDDELALNIDKNTRLIHGRYDNICNRKQGFHLGKAVAASAGVPGIFPPLSISHMYAPLRNGQPTRVQLVDGGVYDNQGIEALFNARLSCTHAIISDASGQMRDQSDPETGTVSVFMRTTDVLMGRVREEMIGQAFRNHEPGHIALMHMTEGLPVRFQHHRGPDCQDHINPRRDVRDPIPKIDPDTRGRLARVRTDLDSFTDVESNCLSAHGYTLSSANLNVLTQHWPGGVNTIEKQDWLFKRVIPWLENPAKGPNNLQKQLDVAEQKFGKAIRLASSKFHWFVLALLGFVAGIAAFLFLLYWIIQQFIPNPLQALLDWLKGYTMLDLMKIIVIILLLHYLGKLGKVVKRLSYAANIHRFVANLLVQAVLPALGAIPVKIYLLTLDKYFVYQGRIEK